MATLPKNAGALDDAGDDELGAEDAGVDEDEAGAEDELAGTLLTGASDEMLDDEGWLLDDWLEIGWLELEIGAWLLSALDAGAALLCGAEETGVSDWLDWAWLLGALLGVTDGSLLAGDDWLALLGVMMMSLLDCCA